jgi:hypothetical protein
MLIRKKKKKKKFRKISKAEEATLRYCSEKTHEQAAS